MLIEFHIPEHSSGNVSNCVCNFRQVLISIILTDEGFIFRDQGRIIGLW